MHITHPLEEYKGEFKHRFREVATQAFEEFFRDSQVDVEANKAVCSEIYGLQDNLGDTRKRLTRTRWLAAFLWIFVVVVVLFIIFSEEDISVKVAAGVPAAICLIVLFATVHPKIKRLKKERDGLENRIANKTGEAWTQMASLNRLYDWDIFYRMFSQTLPGIVFDDFIPTERLSQLRSHGLNTNLGPDTSILSAHSGTIYGNPFVLYRSRTMHWGEKTYTGSITIHWTTEERGADGKYETRYHTETLTASVTKPYPEYPEITHLIYGHSAAPGLTFHRTQNTFDYKEGTLLYKMKKKRLERKSKNLKTDYAMDADDEFEVMFTADDRNDNQQFFLLFTPIAKQNMIKLLRDREDGYGDDFEFIKAGQINDVVSGHMQGVSLDLDPNSLQHFDFEKARVNFIESSCDLFRKIYFSLAPILNIPIYQEAPEGYMTQLTDPRYMESSEWEHESLANFWGGAYFRHPSCETLNILKTDVRILPDGSKNVNVTAHGYASVERVTYISKFGGDGRWHDVPVYWREYYPVVGQGALRIKETDVVTSSQTPAERFNTNAGMIQASGFGSMIRRRIISAFSK